MSPAGGAGTLSTPQHEKAAAHPAGKIEYTSNSCGTAVVSEHISLVGVNVDQIHPWTQHNIQEAKTCKADAMPRVQALLQKCLKALPPVCNERAAGSATKGKRKAQGQLSPEAKRRKPDNNLLDVTVQTGLYAAEMFAASLAVNNVLNLIVVDDVIYIWYYDRQGIIQCSGINFIQDPPRFMVLLYALQRFELRDRGRNTRFLPVQDGEIQCHEITIEDADLGPVDLLLYTSHEERVTDKGLQGRAVAVVPVTSKALEKKFNHIEDGVVAEIFWGEQSRTCEPEILEKVKEIAKVNQSVEGDIPVLLCHEKLTNPTSSIREALDFLEPTKGSRVLNILVFPKLNPITELHGKELFEVWRQCILCHIALWKAGVYHRDVSPGNMMWYRDKLGKLMGVLNDYDLSLLASVPGPHGNERTGTVPFMALDLFTEEAQRGEVKHLYRHDLESFMWILTWIFLRYRNGDLLPPASRPLDIWATSDAWTCYEEKLNFQRYVQKYQPSDIDRSDPNFSDINLRMWALLMDCFLVLKTADHTRWMDDHRCAQEILWGGAGQLTHAEESHSFTRVYHFQELDQVQRAVTVIFITSYPIYGVLRIDTCKFQLYIHNTRYHSR
ncbi:hypothetical protein DEU56DRAFT_573329 [Suillus clintonianus]|uniref:uncharacterized protein n=1 Tax=Suillus clintonianus TaxID=1904413 RepID=UPI001B85C71F|nr:uncharacterized protein DEU56DRAFT_573329 [Suillus clintonianus]KAG2125388.1 hypothetical protein DEU56DRAFT_573329 [Suillus clintonianus]